MEDTGIALLAPNVEITASAHAIGMFRDKSRKPIPPDEEDARVILLSAIRSAKESGDGFWFYDTGAGHAETLALGLPEPYSDMVALLRMDEHKAPSPPFDKSYAAITVMTRVRAHRAKEEGRWVDTYEPITQYISKPSEPLNSVLLTYTMTGQHGSELVAPEEIDKRVSQLIGEGADTLSFVVWERRIPVDRKVPVNVRY